MVSSLIDRGGYPTLRGCVYLNQASLGLIADPAVEAMHDLLDRVVRHGNLHMSDEDEVAFLDGLRRARRPTVVGERPGDRDRVRRERAVGPGALPAGAAAGLEGDRRGDGLPCDHAALAAPARAWRVPRRVRRGSPWIRPDGRSRRPDRRAHIGGCGRVGPIRDGDDDRCSPATSGHCRGRRQARPRRHPGGRCDEVRWEHLARRPVGVQRVQVARRPRRSGDRGARSRCHRPDTAAAGVDGRCLPLRFRRHTDRSAEGARRFTQSTMSYVSVVGLTTAMDQLLAIGLDRVERHATRLHDLLLDAVEDRGWLPFRRTGRPRRRIAHRLTGTSEVRIPRASRSS